MAAGIILQATLRCPRCGHASVESMPTDACIHFHVGVGCGERLSPKPGDCCVFCSYADIQCPPIQQGRRCCS